MPTRKRKSILHYWSIRYFLIMFTGMAIVVAATLFIIQRNSLLNQHSRMEQMVSDIAEEAAANGGRLPGGAEQLERDLIDQAEEAGMPNKPIMFILDQAGKVVQQYPQTPPREADQLTSRMSEIMNGKTHIFALEPLEGKAPLLAAVHPIGSESSITGYVLYLMPKENALQGLIQFRIIRLISFTALLLIGWILIYMMTRYLVKPIQEAAEAAKQIVAGNYNVLLDEESSEKEIYELMDAFKEMGDRLSRLEALRTQLLAGVTHELKTPITSISGLIQAVRDGVVSGEEADAFLDNSLKQTNRLQKMVEDLLDFNSFASNTVAVQHEQFDLKEATRNIVERWRYSQMQEGPEVVFEVIGDAGNWQTLSDPTRIEQIIVNLLNNARDAEEIGEKIRVRLSLKPGSGFHIEVQDSGGGIPIEERENVFEPYYRGENKKRRVRGLGLGLPFSRLIARSLGGNLVLSESGPGGTTFTLLIPARGQWHSLPEAIDK